MKERNGTTAENGNNVNYFAVGDTNEGYTECVWGEYPEGLFKNIEYIVYGFRFDENYAKRPYKVKNIRITSTGNYSNLRKSNRRWRKRIKKRNKAIKMA